MLDLKNNLALRFGVVQAARTNGTVNAAGVDTTGFEACLVEFTGATLTDGSHACSMEDSPDNSVWTAVAAADCINGTALATLAATEDNAIETLGYIGKQKWVRGVIVTTGATTGGIVGVNYVLGHPRHAPVTAQP